MEPLWCLRRKSVDFTGFDSTDGVQLTIGAATYRVFDIGNQPDMLNALILQINADTGVHGWTANPTDADTITLVGPSDGSSPAAASGVTVLDPLPGQQRCHRCNTRHGRSSGLLGGIGCRL